MTLKYELFNVREPDCDIVLIDTDIVYSSLKMKNSDQEITDMNLRNLNAPRQEWFYYGSPLDKFDVPLVDINVEHKINIVDGRHRVCWMKSKGIPKIPVAISKSSHMNEFFKENGIVITYVKDMILPCNITKEPPIPPDITSIVNDCLNKIKKK